MSLESMTVALYYKCGLITMNLISYCSFLKILITCSYFTGTTHPTQAATQSKLSQNLDVTL